MNRRRDVVVEGIAPKARVKPVLVRAPFHTRDGFYARPGDRLLMTPEEIAERVEAHQVRPLEPNATVRLGRFVRRAMHRRSLRRPTP
jgi:hypothetical protein